MGCTWKVVYQDWHALAMGVTTLIIIISLLCFFLKPSLVMLFLLSARAALPSTHYLHWLGGQGERVSTFYWVGREECRQGERKQTIARAGVEEGRELTGSRGFSIVSEARDVVLPWNGADGTWERLLGRAREAVAERVLWNAARPPPGKTGKESRLQQETRGQEAFGEH